MTLAGVAAVAAVAAALMLMVAGGQRRTATASASPARAQAPASVAIPRPHPHVVVALDPGQSPPTDDSGAGTVPSPASVTPPVAAPKPVSDARVRQELATFRQVVQSAAPIRGVPGKVLSDGTAVVPANAPPVVGAVIAAGNEIATKPYKWGGGHGGWADTGYDCSGSVSFALAGAGLLNSPLDSTQFMSWGDPGPGRWISIYASPGHVFMVVGSLRFDTSGATGGTRWQAPQRSVAGFVVRHPPGL